MSINLDTLLDGFLLEVQLEDGSNPPSFKGQVFARDGTKATGPHLFASPTMTVSGAGYNEVTYTTGGVALMAGSQYVLLGSIFDPSLYTASNGNSGRGSPFSDPYGGGDFVYLNNGGNLAAWTTQARDNSGSLDLAFQASFRSGIDAVPEPGTPGMAGIAALGVLAAWGRKRRRAA